MTSTIFDPELHDHRFPDAGVAVSALTGSAFLSVIGPGGLAAEAPGGEAEGGVWRRRHGGEKEAVRQLRTGSAEEPALEAAARAGELHRADHF